MNKNCVMYCWGFLNRCRGRALRFRFCAEGAALARVVGKKPLRRRIFFVCRPHWNGYVVCWLLKALSLKREPPTNDPVPHYQQLVMAGAVPLMSAPPPRAPPAGFDQDGYKNSFCVSPMSGQCEIIELRTTDCRQSWCQKTADPVHLNDCVVDKTGGLKLCVESYSAAAGILPFLRRAFCQTLLKITRYIAFLLRCQNVK